MDIYFVNMAAATGVKEKGTKPRPVVVVEDSKNGLVGVCQVTSRMKTHPCYIRMNSYKIYGYCDCKTIYWIKRSYLRQYVRPCTTSEIKDITERVNFYNPSKRRYA